MFQSGDKLAGKYQLERQLGLGGFSEVWKGSDVEADTDVAVKIFLKQDQSGIDLCREEFKKMSALKHPNILRPFYFSAQDGVPFLVMPFCKGGTALSKMQELDERQLAEAIKQMASALHYIHHLPEPILHNDIKPDNFLIESDGEYLLADFGISEQLSRKLSDSQDEERRTRHLEEEQRKGFTPMAYRAPELVKFKDKPRQTAVKATDIWAFGSSIYQLAVGHPPFENGGGQQQLTYYDLQKEVGMDEIVPALPAPFSRGLDRLLKTCLEPNPWDRPTAQQLVEHAEHFLKKGVWPAELDARPEPALLADAHEIHFGKVKQFTEGVRPISFTASYMPGEMRLNAFQPFSISFDGLRPTSTLNFRLSNATERKMIYVHFHPHEMQKQTGALTFSWGNRRMLTVELSGQGEAKRDMGLVYKIAGGVGAAATVVVAGLAIFRDDEKNSTLPPINTLQEVKDSKTESEKSKVPPPSGPSKTDAQNEEKIEKKGTPAIQNSPTGTPPPNNSTEQEWNKNRTKNDRNQ